MPLLVEGILHCLAIYRQRLVLRSPHLIPCIEAPVQHSRLNADQAISNHRFAGNEIVSVLRRQSKRSRACGPKLSAQLEIAL